MFFDEGGSDGGAAVAAAEQAEAHGGVGLIAEGGGGLDEEQAGGCGGGLDEVASVHDAVIPPEYAHLQKATHRRMEQQFYGLRRTEGAAMTH